MTLQSIHFHHRPQSTKKMMYWVSYRKLAHTPALNGGWAPLVEKPLPLQRDYSTMQIVNMIMQQTRRLLQQSREMRCHLVMFILGSLVAFATTTPTPDGMQGLQSYFVLATDTARFTKVLSQAMLAVDS